MKLIVWIKQIFCLHSSWAKAAWKPYSAQCGYNYYVCKECGTVRNFGFSLVGWFAFPNLPINYDCSDDTWITPAPRDKGE